MILPRRIFWNMITIVVLAAVMFVFEHPVIELLMVLLIIAVAYVTIVLVFEDWDDMEVMEENYKDTIRKLESECAQR